MDISDYRKQVAEELERASGTVSRLVPNRSDRRPLSVMAADADRTDTDEEIGRAEGLLLDAAAAPERRIDALVSLRLVLRERPALVAELIEVMEREATPAALRVAVLEALQQLKFDAERFAPHRPRFMAALRSMVDSQDESLRRRALAVLAREKDGFAQARLIEGLEEPEKALIPADKAIQLLGYDVHADSLALLQRIIARPPSQAARNEALRVLATQPDATETLVGIMRDRGEPNEDRRISAVGLMSLAPERFTQEARRVALDESEDDQLRATVIVGLAQIGDDATSEANRAEVNDSFLNEMRSLQKTSASAALRRAAQRWAQRFQQ
jgi:hypothetical protein